MSDYKIDYEILTPEKLQKRLENIMFNPENKFKVVKLDDLGHTSCGFSIEHYSIGNGPFHITYMGGAHGNEIIGVDFVTQLMQNLALGINNFVNFDPNLFTIDFIPVQNPEGFAVTTYALDSVMKNMSDEEIERFSKNYWSLFRLDDQNVLKVNKMLGVICDKFLMDKNKVINRFWLYFQGQDITKESVKKYLESTYGISGIDSVFDEVLDKNISKIRKHSDIFNVVTSEVIPEVSEAHVNLKNKIMKMFSENDFPLGSLANFYANSNGVNLNDNNPLYYEIMKKQIIDDGAILGNLRDNHITKSVVGPIGMANYDMDKEFRFELENEALLNYLEKLDRSGGNMAFFNCHGTGGLLYIYPAFERDMEKAHAEGVTSDFSFFINSRIATEYTNATGEEYRRKTGKFDPYKTMGHPNKVTGVGDLLRQKYIASFILELSKMGGNPIAPYGDRDGNYNLTMTSNFAAFSKTLETILSIRYLYESSYKMSYDEFGRVHYEEVLRK